MQEHFCLQEGVDPNTINLVFHKCRLESYQGWLQACPPPVYHLLLHTGVEAGHGLQGCARPPPDQGAVHSGEGQLTGEGSDDFQLDVWVVDIS
jgi:hypothetical protein